MMNTKSTHAFRLGKSGRNIEVWGLEDSLRPLPVCFPEWLPALFQRELKFEQLDLTGSSLKWVFTGPRAGLTLLMESGRISAEFRYFDSPGLHERPPMECETPPRHPERITQRREAETKNTPRSVVIRKDHHFDLNIEVDGEPCIQMHCDFDLHQHQLQWQGGDGEAIGTLEIPEARAARLDLLSETTHQTMLGFGGIASPPAYQELSPNGKKRWWELLVEYNLLIQREYPMSGELRPDCSNWEEIADAVPHNYGDNPCHSEISDFEYNRGVLALGGQIWFEFWYLPRWMLRGESKTNRSFALTEEEPDPELYADAIVSYCRASQQASGKPPAIVGVQNEACPSTSSLTEMVSLLRSKLNEAGFQQTKIHMANAPVLRHGVEFCHRHREAGIWPLIDFSATNQYDLQEHFKNADEGDQLLLDWKQASGDKPFLSTEICVNNPKHQVSSYALALAMGQIYHKTLVLADATAICYCWLLLSVPQPSYCWTRSLLLINAERERFPEESSHQLRVFGAYSRRVREGMERIEARCEDPDLLCCAFKEKNQDSAQTVIFLNRGITPCQVRIPASVANLPFAELSDLYHQNREIVPPVKDGTLEVPPGAIVTLSSIPLLQLPENFAVPNRESSTTP